MSQQLLPKARQSLEVARSGYLGGQIDFFNLTDSERTLLGFELENVESAMQREVALAELSLIIQGMPPAGGPMGPSSTRTSRGTSSAMKKTRGM